MLKDLVQKLRRIRERSHISQEQLCDKMGVEKTYVSILESGRRNNLSKTIYKYANALGYTIKLVLIPLKCAGCNIRDQEENFMELEEGFYCSKCVKKPKKK